MGHVHLVFSTPLVPTILLSSLLWFPKVLVMFGYVTLSHQLLEEVSLLTTGLSNVTMSIVEYLQESFYYFFLSFMYCFTFGLRVIQLIDSGHLGSVGMNSHLWCGSQDRPVIGWTFS